jgi:drug/metabolite transporter (DMT)-like permease
LIPAYIWVALLSAATLGLVTALDKRLVSHNMPSLSSFYMGVGISLFGYGTAVLIIGGVPEEAPLDALVMAGASGLCWGAALALMFLGYKFEEASRASAIIHTFPVFVAILAVIFLDETMGLGQWAAVMVIVAGAFLISLRGSIGRRVVRFNRAFPILVGASLFTALALLTGKYALEALPVPFVFSLRNYGMGAVFMLLWRPGAFRQLAQAVSNGQTLLLLVLAEFTLAPLAVFLNVVAINLGPVSQVGALTGTRPFFVFIFSSLLSVPAIRLLNEPLERSTLGVKLASIFMIVGGIGALTLL